MLSTAVSHGSRLTQPLSDLAAWTAHPERYQAPELGAAILRGEVRGRVVVDVNA